MKISKVIADLEKIKMLNGDLEVHLSVVGCDAINESVAEAVDDAWVMVNGKLDHIVVIS